MRLLLFFTTFLLATSFAGAALFTQSESHHLALAGRKSVVETTNAHIDSHRRTGVGLFYGDLSPYSPRRRGGWSNHERIDYVRKHLRPEFVKDLQSSRAVDDFVRAIVGDQDTVPRSGQIEMGRPLQWVFRHLEAAYSTADKRPRWLQIRKLVHSSKTPPFTLAKELQKDGWESVYWNPDTRAPGIHMASAKAVLRQNLYYPLAREKSELTDEEIILIDHHLVDYHPRRGPARRSALKRLVRVPFWIGLANFGRHMFVGHYDKVNESHPLLLPHDREVIVQERFVEWSKIANPTGDAPGSGVILVPPGLWN